jgi:2-C-methyl-D-erythritol 4-phosphate cytidylyltransferase
VQTPQVFQRDVLERVLAQPDEVLAAAPTTPRWSRRPAAACGWSRRRGENLKVTTPVDLRVAELLLDEAQRTR